MMGKGVRHNSERRAVNDDEEEAFNSVWQGKGNRKGWRNGQRLIDSSPHTPSRGPERRMALFLSPF